VIAWIACGAAARYSLRMTQSPTMEPRELKDQSGWYVRLTWANGSMEDIDVSSEVEAIEWIRDKSTAWLARRAAGV
jgi:hypothetical protein